MMFLANVLDICSTDLDYIHELVHVVADDKFGYTVRDALADLPLNQIDANTLIEVILRRINGQVFSEIKRAIENGSVEVSDASEEDALLDLCQERLDEFSPQINVQASSFNNELDQVTIRGNRLNHIVEAVIPLFVENARNDIPKEQH